MSINNKSPQTFLGGTWVSWGSGRVPVGVNTNDTNFNTVEKTGGESTHKLVTSEMPSHNHSGQFSYDSTSHKISNVGCYQGGGGTLLNVLNIESSTTHSIIPASNGSNGSHNNLQPYITCYMYKRTA